MPANTKPPTHAQLLAASRRKRHELMATHADRVAEIHNSHPRWSERKIWRTIKAELASPPAERKNLADQKNTDPPQPQDSTKGSKALQATKAV